MISATDSAATSTGIYVQSCNFVAGMLVLYTCGSHHQFYQRLQSSNCSIYDCIPTVPTRFVAYLLFQIINILLEYQFKIFEYNKFEGKLQRGDHSIIL